MFQRIKAKNLFSWSELDYEIRPGLSQVSGFNYDDNNNEGCGKSAIFNILCWTVFGKLPKNINVDEVIKEGEKGCLASVTLTNGTTITRGRKPNILKVETSEGSLVGKDNKDTQHLLEKHLNLSYDLFCQTIYFYQNSDNKFLTANETAKVEILSKIQDLDVFDAAGQDCVSRIAKLKSELDKYKLEFEKKAAKIEAFKQFESSAENDSSEKSNKSEELKTILNELKAELLTSNRKLDQEYRSVEENLTFVSKSMEKERAALEEEQRRLARLEERKRALEESLLANQKISHDLILCPNCSHEFQSEQSLRLQEHYNDVTRNLEDIKESIVDAAQNVLLFKEDFDIVKGFFDTAKMLVSEKEKLERKITEQEKEITHVEKMLKIEENSALSLENNKKILADQLKKLQNEILDIVMIIDEHQDKIQELEKLRTGFKQTKSFIFQFLLDDLSIKASTYAQELFDTTVVIKFTNEGENESISKIRTEIKIDGVERSLGLLSGGQTRRIQIAVDLGLSEIFSKRSKNPINFRILDEITKDLSTASIERLIKILERLGGSTIIIDHSELIKPIVNNDFCVKLINGTSYVD